MRVVEDGSYDSRKGKGNGSSNNGRVKSLIGVGISTRREGLHVRGAAVRQAPT
jgi:hypothetical protein